MLGREYIIPVTGFKCTLHNPVLTHLLTSLRHSSHQFGKVTNLMTPVQLQYFLDLALAIYWGSIRTLPFWCIELICVVSCVNMHCVKTSFQKMDIQLNVTPFLTQSITAQASALLKAVVCCKACVSKLHCRSIQNEYPSAPFQAHHEVPAISAS